MAKDVDRLSDLANTASDLARRSDLLSDHAAAATAHKEAYRAIKAGGGDRPSLFRSHLNQAVRHDKIATDPESYAQNDVLARAADKRAEREETAGAHETAAKAHEAAAKAYRKENPTKTGDVGGMDPWELRSHLSSAQQHRETAAFLKKQGEGSTSMSLDESASDDAPKAVPAS